MLLDSLFEIEKCHSTRLMRVKVVELEQGAWCMGRRENKRASAGGEIFQMHGGLKRQSIAEIYCECKKFTTQRRIDILSSDRSRLEGLTRKLEAQKFRCHSTEIKCSRRGA
jgi:hypothetical protein